MFYNNRASSWLLVESVVVGVRVRVLLAFDLKAAAADIAAPSRCKLLKGACGILERRETKPEPGPKSVQSRRPTSNNPL